MASDKILTVIVPSYNMEKYLPKCLGSLVVAPELMEKLEVLVVNDGSKDRTSEIAHEFAAKWPETFKVIDKKNGHYGSCVNAGLQIAAGRFVRVLDADDFYERANFEKWLTQIEVVEDDVDMVLTDHSFDRADGTVTVREGLGLPTGISFDVDRLAPAYDRIMIWDTAYRTEVFRQISYVQTEGVAYSDMQWVSLPVAVVRKVVYLPLHLYHYRTGRVGQSVDPAIMRKSAPMLVRVMKDMIVWFTKNKAKFPGANCRYIEKQIFRQARITYAMYLYHVPLGAIEKELRPADQFLKRECVSVYRDMDRSFVLVSKRFGFPVVAAWRKLGPFGFLSVLLARTYVSAARALRMGK